MGYSKAEAAGGMKRQKAIEDYYTTGAGSIANRTPDGPGGSLSPEQKAKEDADLAQIDADNPIRAGDPYNPGSADVGGAPNGASLLQSLASQGMASNDRAQAANENAMGTSLGGMLNGRGNVYENGRLSANEAYDRKQQLGVLDLNRQAALGQAPSAAGYQTKMAMNGLLGQNAAAMGSARGLSGLNGAQTMGSGMAGQQASDIAAQGGMARSKEIADAMGMYGSMAGNVRAQDLGRLQLNQQNAMTNAGLNNAYRVNSANLLASQGQLGNAQASTDQAWMDEWQKPIDQQFGYDQEMAAMEAGADADATAAQIAAKRESAAHTRKLVQGGTTVALTGIGTVAGGPVGGAIGAGAAQGINSATEDDY